METIIVSYPCKEEVVYLKHILGHGLRNCQIENGGDVFNLEKYCISYSDPVSELKTTLVDPTSGWYIRC